MAWFSIHPVYSLIPPKSNTGSKSDTAISEMTAHVRQFLTNGGQQAFITRIGKGSQAASIRLMDGEQV